MWAKPSDKLIILKSKFMYVKNEKKYSIVRIDCTVELPKQIINK